MKNQNQNQIEIENEIDFEGPGDDTIVMDFTNMLEFEEREEKIIPFDQWLKTLK